jgi:fumarate reductase (CoM/CoB) subunit B
MGEIGLAEEVVLKNVDILEDSGVGRVVTLCAHCAFTMREDWPSILQKKRGTLPKFEVFDISAYLAKEIRLNTEALKSLKMSVTYHDPCYLNRGLDMSREPRELLKKIPGVRLIEMGNSDRCCGAGGEVKDGAPEFAKAITSIKIESIRKTHADAVVTVCPHCVEQIAEVSAAYGTSYQCLNIVELLSRSYQG